MNMLIVCSHFVRFIEALILHCTAYEEKHQKTQNEMAALSEEKSVEDCDTDESNPVESEKQENSKRNDIEPQSQAEHIHHSYSINPLQTPKMSIRTELNWAGTRYM